MEPYLSSPYTPSWRGQGQLYRYIYRGICLELKDTKSKEEKNILRTNKIDPFKEQWLL
jgi:hypothetical protein